MPLHSALEEKAFDPGCVAKKRPGALFVDLDGDQVTWNADAGLPPPRIVQYDVDVASGRVEYNGNGWNDRNGHHYRITGITISQLDAAGEVTTSQPFPPPPFSGPAPFFPRANQGDIVELTFHNALGTLPADDFDLITPPVEWGLHVHLRVARCGEVCDQRQRGWKGMCSEGRGRSRCYTVATRVELSDPLTPRLGGAVGLRLGSSRGHRLIFGWRHN
jgi:hypothetical protein